jgi:hypothetical protein
MNHTTIAMAATAMVLIAALIVAGLNYTPTQAHAKTTSNVRVAEAPNSSSDTGSSHGHLKASDVANQYLHNPDGQYTIPTNGQAQPQQQQPQQQQQQGPAGQPSAAGTGAGGGSNPNPAMSPEQIQQLMGMLSGTRANTNMGVGQQQQQQPQGPASGAGGGPMGLISGLLNNLPLSSGSSSSTK